MRGRAVKGGRTEERKSERTLEGRVTVRRRLARADPAAYAPDLATSLNNLSLRLGEAGRRDDAERARREALDVQDRVDRRRGGSSSKSD